MLALVLTAALAQTVQQIPSYRDGVAAAVADVQAMIESGDDITPLFWRYLWCSGEHMEHFEAVHASLVGALNHAQTVPIIEVLPDGHTVRINLLWLSGDAESFEAIRKTWDALASGEPYYLIDETHAVDGVRVSAFPFEHGGELWRYKVFSKPRTWRQFGAHIEADWATLQRATGCEVPIVRFDYAHRRLNSSLTNDGGLYYQARNYPRATGGQSDFDRFVEKNKIRITDLEQGGFTKWAGQFSRISPNPRSVMFLRHLRSRPTVNQGLAVMTLDSSEEDFHFKIEFDPIRAVPNVQHTAMEVFVERPDGLIDFALFSADQSLFDGSVTPRISRGRTLQNEAPAEVVTDWSMGRNQPSPHREIAAVGCYRCHSKGENWYSLPFKDSVQEYIRDFEIDYLPINPWLEPDTFRDRVHAVYAADQDRFAFERLITRCREDLRFAHLSISGFKETSVVWAQIAEFYDRYWFDTVGPIDILKEHGFSLDTEEAAIQFLDSRLGYSEEPIISIIRRGRSVHRTQYDSVFSAMAERLFSDANPVYGPSPR